MTNILDFFPEELKTAMLDGMVDFLSNQAQRIAGDQVAKAISQLSSQAAFYNAFDKSMEIAIKRFSTEYMEQDEDLVEAIISDGDFWKSKGVRQALIELVCHPGYWHVEERERIDQHFADLLPQRVNRNRVNKAVVFFLRCVVEELWTMPGAREIREIYSLQFQKMSADAARQQVALLEAQLQATTQLSTDVREALLQLATMFEKRLLSAPQIQSALPSPSQRPYHNLPHPDYTRFVGRQKELEQLRRHLSPSDRVWQIVIAGIGGVGKSSLALAIAHDYLERYTELSPEERFEAIIWISAKKEILTITGRKQAAPSNMIFRTLEDMYTTIAQTLEREDITRALPQEQDRLVQKALSAQRTLLIVDNLESVKDERIRTFLYNLPMSTKCIITSRQWVEVAVVLKLIGLPSEEAENLIIEEATIRKVVLDEAQRQRMIERTSGLPLPIKLSIARIASDETFDQVLRWLGDYSTGDLPDYCVKGQIEMARKHDPDAWKLLLACSLFNQEAGASREALGFVADLSLVDRDDGLTLLQRLSLINRTENNRFWLLPLVQEYVGNELTRTDFYEELIDRWLSWLLKFSQHYGINLEYYGENTQMVSSEYPNLLRAIRWCYEHERREMLLQLTEGTWFYPHLVGLFGELREMLEAAVQASEALRDEQREGRFMQPLGELFWIQGQLEKAQEYLDTAKKIAIRYGDDVERGRVEHIRAHILYNQGHLQDAKQLARQTLEMGEQLNNLNLKFLGIYRLVGFAFKEQQFDRALECLDRGEQWCKESGWSRGLAWLMYLRGTTLIKQGNALDAEPFLLQSLKMSTSWNERRLIAHNKHRLTQVYADTNRLQLALQMAEDARDLYERLGMTKELAEVQELLRTMPGNGDNK